jgi:hypothetical protein
LENCIGFLVGSPEEVPHVSYVSAGWIRPHPGPFSWGFIEKSPGDFDFSFTDNVVRTAGKEGVGVLATVWPFADWDQQKCAAKKCKVSTRDMFYPRAKMGFTEGIPASRCKPCDMGSYRLFLSKLVERYDGDGVDDMPGLKVPVFHWEILNEPSMQEADMTFFKGDEADYVEILEESYATVKAACPDCLVVQGGASGTAPDTLYWWGQVFELGGADYFDIANIHYIGTGDWSTLNVAGFKETMKEHSVEKPVWVTEAEFRAVLDIDMGVDGALEAGAKKVFFVGFGAGHGRLEDPKKFKDIYTEQKNKCS